MATTVQDVEEWEQMFQELIREVKPWHKWTLVTDKDLLPGVLQQGWSQYQQRTFARFRCSSCSRSWASAHVQVLFHLHWSGKKCRGQVRMRVFSQRCKKCAQPRFEVPEFMLENIRRTLTNLVFRILERCYKEGFKTMEEMAAIKDMSLEGPHDSLNCEACLQGFCAQSGASLASQPSVPPSLSTPSKDTGMSRVTTACSHRPCSPPPQVDQLLVSTVTPKDPNLLKAEPKVSHTSKPSAAPPKEMPPTLIVNPKVSSPPSPEDKVLTWLAAQVPSPTNSRTIADEAAWDTRATTGEIPPSSPWPARSTWGRGHSSWDQRGRTIGQVDIRAPMPPTWSETCSCICRALQNCIPGYGCLCCCCCLLLILGAWWWF